MKKLLGVSLGLLLSVSCIVNINASVVTEDSMEPKTVVQTKENWKTGADEIHDIVEDEADVTEKMQKEIEADVAGNHEENMTEKLQEEDEENTQENDSSKANNDQFNYTASKTEVKLSKYIGTDVNVVIPSIIEGLPVTEIGAKCFQNSTIQTITIPDSVRVINSNAFDNCLYLNEVTFSEGLTTISYNAFRGCTSLSGTIRLPKTVESIGSNAFANCNNLMTLQVPTTITSMNLNALNKENRTKKIALQVYHAATNEILKNTFVHKSGCWYLLNKDGKLANGWDQYKGNWYYFKEFVNIRGKSYTVTIHGKKYFFTADGKMLTNWQHNIMDQNYWYYFGKDGAMRTGWQLIDGKWYWFNTSGWMKTGWLSEGNTWYLLGSNGAMKTGWQKVDGSYYYFNKKGNAAKGWVKVNNKWYSFSNKGRMRDGWYTENGAKYYLGNKTDGTMKIGWQKINKSWYYFRTNGVMQKDWHKIQGKWYYFYASGIMAHDCTIDGYRLGSNGAMI